MLSRSLSLARNLRATPSLRAFATHPQYEMIKTEVVGRVGVITLHRPKALNALCDQLVDEVITAGKVFSSDDSVGAIVITGSEKAFAAGADIKEMKDRTYPECYHKNLFANWNEISKLSKPVSCHFLNPSFLNHFNLLL